MEPAKDTLDRIYSAADALYEQADRAGFPTVDAVRKAARVNMNDANVGMRQWRRAHMAKAAPLAVQVPESVQQAGGTAIAVLWREAQALAHEALHTAQAGWEAERAETETLNRQMADAFEAQTHEVDAARLCIGQLKADAEHLVAENARLDGERASAIGAAGRAEVRIIEIERRAGELRAELDHAHQMLIQVQAGFADVRDAHSAELERLRIALANEQEKAGSAREQAREETSRVHKEAALLRGQAEALREQNAILMRSVWSGKAGDGPVDLPVETGHG